MSCNERENSDLISEEKTDFEGQRFRAAHGYIMRNVVGEFLLIPVAIDECDTSKVSIFNETGAFLWEKLQDAKSFNELVKDMLDEFDVTESQATVDVGAFMHILLKNNLIHVETEVM